MSDKYILLLITDINCYHCKNFKSNQLELLKDKLLKLKGKVELVIVEYVGMREPIKPNKRVRDFVTEEFNTKGTFGFPSLFLIMRKLWDETSLKLEGKQIPVTDADHIYSQVESVVNVKKGFSLFGWMKPEIQIKPKQPKQPKRVQKKDVVAPQKIPVKLWVSQLSNEEIVPEYNHPLKILIYDSRKDPAPQFSIPERQNKLLYRQI